MRFARVKQYRADKSALEADTIDTIRALHAAQSDQSVQGKPRDNY